MKKYSLATIIGYILTAIIMLVYLAISYVLLFQAGHNFMEMLFDMTHLHWITATTYMPRFVCCALCAAVIAVVCIIERKSQERIPLALLSVMFAISAGVAMWQIATMT